MATRKSTIEVVIDSSKAKSGAKDVQDQYTRMLKAALAFSNSSLNAMKRASVSGVSAMKSMTSSTVRALKSMGRVVSSTFKSMISWYDKSIASAERLKRRMSPISSIFSTIKSSLTSLKTAAAGGVLVVMLKELVQAGLLMQRFRTTLTVITGSVAAANKELEWLRNTVDRVGISFTQSAQPFARFAAAAAEIFNTTQIRNVFSAFAEASAALHLGEQEINGVFLALQQMVSKGKISMEELRLQLAERIPGAMRLAADSMGTTITDLEDQIRRRALSAEDFLGKFAKAIHEKFGAAAQTASSTAIGAFSRLRTAVFSAAVMVAESGMMTSLGDGATRLAAMLDANTSKIKTFGKHLSNAIKLFVDKLINIRPEDASRAFVSISDAMGTVHRTFVAVSNSSFFVWLVGKSEKTIEIEKLTGQIAILKTAFASIPQSFKDRDASYSESFSAQLDVLEKKLAQVRNQSVLTVTALNTVQDVTRRNKDQPILKISDDDYQDQINAILSGVERIKDPATKVNGLFKKRNDLSSTSLELLEKINSVNKYSAEERSGFAREYRRAVTDLISVQIQLNDEIKVMPTQFDLAAAAAIKLNVSFDNVVSTLNLKIKMLGMTQRAQFIYNQVLAAGITEEGKMKLQVEALAGSLYDQSTALKVAAKSTQGLATVMSTQLAREIERLDDAFVDLWKSGLDSFEDFKSSLVNSFKQMMATLIHEATTKKLVTFVGGLLSAGGSATATATATGGSGASNFVTGGVSSADLLSGAASFLASPGTAMSNSAFRGIAHIGTALHNAGFESAAETFVTSSSDAVANLTPASAGASLVAGYAGSQIGNVVGEGVFGKQAESNYGSMAGGVAGGVVGGAMLGATYGSYAGPIGALIGAAIGALIDVAAGGDGKKRVKLGVGTGSDLFKGGSVQDSVIASSGLELTALAKRVGDGSKGQSAIDMMNALAQIDEVLTATTKLAGETVNLADVSLAGRSTQGDGRGPATGFGSFGFNTLDVDGIMSAPREFIKAWIDEVSATFDDTLRSLVVGLSGTAEEIVNQYADIMVLTNSMDNFDALYRLPLDMSTLFEDALAIPKTTYETFNGMSDALVLLADSADASSVTLLSSALQDFAGVSAQLVKDIRSAQESLAQSTLSLIDKIQFGMLQTEQEKYDFYRDKANQLASILPSLSDPAQIASTASQITQLAGNAYGTLGTNARLDMGAEIIEFVQAADAHSQELLSKTLERIQTEADPEAAGSVANSIEVALNRWSDDFTARMQVHLDAAAAADAASSSEFGGIINLFGGFVHDLPNRIELAVDVNVDASELVP